MMVAAGAAPKKRGSAEMVVAGSGAKLEHLASSWRM